MPLTFDLVSYIVHWQHRKLCANFIMCVYIYKKHVNKNIKLFRLMNHSYRTEE